MSVFENIKKELDKISEYTLISDRGKEYLLKHKSLQKSVLRLNNNDYPAWRISC